jgi:uncharacterized cofD-like protein
VSRSGLTKWIYVGLHIKRWLVLLLLGVAVMGLGFAYLLREFYLVYTFPEWTYYATLQFIPRWLRGMMFISVASALTLFAGWRLNRSLATSLVNPGDESNIVDLVYQRRTLSRGPKIVAIGGGTGLANLLRGLKKYSSNLTAVVTVADDGGSSGRLRRDRHIIPPGDIRNCIAALAEAEPLVTQLFQHRFAEHEGDDIGGHSFGNLFITAMADVTGSMELGIAETSRVLNVRGAIVPASLADVTLSARFRDGTTIHGESKIPDTGEPPVEVFIDPSDVMAHPAAVRAIREADFIVIGPGSLYTSILPNLLVPEIGRALVESAAHRVYISNVATQRGETDGYTAADHYGALRRHLKSDAVAQVVLANSNLPSDPFPEEWRSTPVTASGDADYGNARLVLLDIVDHERRYRHDVESLATAVMRLYYERDLRTQPAVDTAAAPSTPD